MLKVSTLIVAGSATAVMLVSRRQAMMTCVMLPPASSFRRKPSKLVAVDIIPDVANFIVPVAVTLLPTTGAPSMAPALLVLQTKPRDHSRQRGSVLSAPGFKLVTRYVASIFHWMSWPCHSSSFLPWTPVLRLTIDKHHES